MGPACGRRISAGNYLFPPAAWSLRRGRPADFQQAAAELLGAELHRAIREECRGLCFDWFFEELAEAA